MHILIIPSWYPKNKADVAGVFFREQALALKEEGVNVGVIALYFESLHLIKPSNLPYRFHKEIDNGIPTYRCLSYRFIPRSEKCLVKIWNYTLHHYLKKYIKNYGKPDLVHVHGAAYAGISVLNACNKFNLKYIITEHSTGFARNIYSDYLLGQIKSVFANAKKLIAVSEDFKQLLIEMFSLSESNCEYVPNIVSPRFFHTPFREKKEGGKYTLGTLSLLSPKKGHEDLLYAFALALKQRKDIELVIGGEGELLENLINLTKKLKIEHKVNFVGKIPPNETPGFFKELDLFVLPSHFETFGVVLIEALACGVPVLATDCGGPSSIIIEEKIGRLSPPRNSKIFSKNILEIIETYAYDRKELREYARSNFSTNVVVKRLLSIYEEGARENKYCKN